jgi:hypothetical protein
MVELEVPLDMNGLIHVEKPVIMEHDHDGDYYLARLSPEILGAPIFPGSYMTLRRKIHTHVRIEHLDKRPIQSRQYIKIGVFADEMPPLRVKLDIASVLAGWTPLQHQDPQP